MQTQNIGVIGAGLMGHGIGKNIVTKGYGLTVLAHRNRAPVEDLIAKGAKEAKSAREVAEKSDVTILCVTGSLQVEAAIFGAAAGLRLPRCGLAAGLRRGAGIGSVSGASLIL